MRTRRGFSLIEIMMTMAIVMVVSGLVYPQLSDLVNVAPTTTMSFAVRQIRQQIAFHREVGDCPMSLEGNPTDVDGRWFPRGQLPIDPWTQKPLKVQVVQANHPEPNPSQMSFQLGSNAHTAWYNSRTGTFFVKVPKRGTNEEIEALFWQING